MKTLAAINLAATLMQTALNAITAAGQVSAVIQKAQADGRADLSPEELASVRAIDDSARRTLSDAISAANT